MLKMAELGVCRSIPRLVAGTLRRGWAGSASLQGSSRSAAASMWRPTRAQPAPGQVSNPRGVALISHTRLGAMCCTVHAAGDWQRPVRFSHFNATRQLSTTQAASGSSQTTAEATQEDKQSGPVDSSAVDLVVRSYYVANEIDVPALCLALPPRWQFKSDKDGALLRLKSGDRTVPEGDSTTVAAEDSYVSVFRSGAMVFVNCDWETYREVFHLIGDAHQRTVEPGSHMEDCVVSVKPQHNVWSSFEDGRLVVQRLDVDNIRILNNIMAQTVILDYNEREVDAMLSTVRGLNSALEGHSSEMPRPPALYATLAQSNNISIKAIMLGVTQNTRPGSTAWKDERLFQLQEILVEEYELEDRFEHLDRKLTYINEITKYCLEIQKDNHFIRLERMIVFLIMAEIAVSLIDMPFAQYASSAWAMLSHVVK